MLGKMLNIPETINPPALILFSSSFCSKCLWNQKMFSNFKEIQKHLYIINISKNHSLTEQVRPRTVPLTLLLDDNGKIIGFKEGILTIKEAEIFVKTLKSLLNF